MSDRPHPAAEELVGHWVLEIRRFQSEVDMDPYEPYIWHFDDWVGMLHTRTRIADAVTAGEPEPAVVSQADAAFLDMTDPDERGLVIKHGTHDAGPGWPVPDGWWWRRLPRGGEPRRDLEHREAGTPDDRPSFTLVGKRMRTLSGVFDEFARAFSFPAYFGRNFAALSECLTDLDWLPPMETYAVYIMNAEHVLVDEPERLPVLRGVLDDATAEWATPVTEGEWQREARRFKVWWIDLSRSARNS